MTNFLLTLQVIGVALTFGYIVYIVTTKRAGAYSVLTAALASAFLNCFAYAMFLFSESLETALAVKPFDIMGSALALYLLYWFVRNMQGVKIPKAVSAALLIADLFGIVCAATDNAFHLYYKSITPIPDADFFRADTVYSVGFYVLLVSMIAKTGIIIVISACGYIGKKRQNAGSALWSFFTVILPMIAMVAYSFSLLGDFNPSSLMVCASCVTITAAVHRGRKYDMVNSARDSVIETMRDALIVTDSKMNIVDSNPAARRIFPVISEGSKTQTALFTANLVSDDKHREFELNGKFYEKHINRLLSVDGSENGYSVLIIDITDTKKYIDRLI